MFCLVFIQVRDIFGEKEMKTKIFFAPHGWCEIHVGSVMRELMIGGFLLSRKQMHRHSEGAHGRS